MTVDTLKELPNIILKQEETKDQSLFNKNIIEQDVTKTPKFEIKESSIAQVSTNDSLVFKLNKQELLEKIASLN
jgi:hypothetical protein